MVNYMLKIAEKKDNNGNYKREKKGANYSTPKA